MPANCCSTKRAPPIKATAIIQENPHKFYTSKFQVACTSNDDKYVLVYKRRKFCFMDLDLLILSA